MKCWTSVLYEGLLPHKLKEMCRIRISVAHRCGYCSTVRSNVARAEDLSEDLVNEVLKERPGSRLTPRKRAALEYADLFKSGDEAIDSDAVYEHHRARHEHPRLGRSLRALSRSRYRVSQPRARRVSAAYGKIQVSAKNEK